MSDEATASEKAQNQTILPMKRSIEHLSHFNCPHCKGWFSIGDAPTERKAWFCPWCGKESPVGDS